MEERRIFDPRLLEKYDCTPHAAMAALSALSPITLLRASTDASVCRLTLVEREPWSLSLTAAA